MAGLNFTTGLGSMSGVQPAAVPTYANAGSPTVMQAAFGPGVTVPVEKSRTGISPATPTGMTLWVGVAAVVALVLIRQSLPN